MGGEAVSLGLEEQNSTMEEVRKGTSVGQEMRL